MHVSVSKGCRIRGTDKHGPIGRAPIFSIAMYILSCFLLCVCVLFIYLFIYLFILFILFYFIFFFWGGGQVTHVNLNYLLCQYSKPNLNSN